MQHATSSYVPLLLALILVAAAGCEPKDRRPGTWLSGKEVQGPVADWSFVNDHREVYVETRPWYGIPHSVTTVIASKNGKVFVPSIYEAPAAFPGTKYWNRIIASNPSVRIKIGDAIYPMQAYPAADGEEFQEGLAALADKYEFWRSVREGREQLPFVIIRMVPGRG